MKLKNTLIIVFMTLTLIPIVIISFLLYKSAYQVSKESYTRNLTESITVQADYISQTLENDMVSDYRIATQNDVLAKGITDDSKESSTNLHIAFQNYLESAADKVSVCVLLNKENTPIYTIGEKASIDALYAQLPPTSNLTEQIVMEFLLKENTYSLGIVTPILDSNHTYVGSLISVYDESYLFKIISSYYKISNTSTYICRSDGDIINFRELSDKTQNTAIGQALIELTFTTEGPINMRIGKIPISGFYKDIDKSPWFLVGFLDNKLVHSFTNQYVLVYILIILCVLIADIILAVYFSQKVVEPISNLIKIMEGYPNNLDSCELQTIEKGGYFETKFLRTKFLEMIKRILLIQHNFEGVYQLYQSGNMSDTNIDINVMEQTIFSNKEVFQNLMNKLKVSSEACIVEKFTNCFCEKDQQALMDIFEDMRDRHLSVPCEAEVYTPYFDSKWFHILVVPMYENVRLSHLFIQLRDITIFKKQELKSNEVARRDSLTGLYNRAGFIECVNTSLQEEDTSSVHGLLFIDMDYFKMVNDNFGHSKGDELLRSVGHTLSASVGPKDIVSRFGGDEFALFLPNTSVEDISIIKENLNKQLIYPYHSDEITFTVTASIGVSIWSSESPYTLEELLQQADVAMYQAKKRVKQSENN